MGKRRKSLIPGLSWSWKRAVGLSGLKTKVSRKIGVPLTKGGLQRKVGAYVLGRIGCVIPAAVLGSGLMGVALWAGWAVA